MDHCRFGARCTNKNCKYRHDGLLPARAAGGQPSERPCVFFQQGKCQKGTKCTFKHEIVSASTAGLADGSPALDLRSLITCKFHQEGKCLKGSECPYAHPESTVADKDAEASNGTDSFRRPYSGALVSFTAGCAVSTIALTHEFSTVRLTGLPQSTTTSVAEEFINALGCDIPAHTTIEVLPTAASAVVYVTAQDSSFARTFCTNLKSTPFNRAELSGVYAAKVRTRLPGWTAVGYSRRDKVAVTWQNPTRSAILHYWSWDKEIAETVRAFFRDGAFKLCGQKVYAGAALALQGPRITLILQNVPFNITEDDIKNSIPSRAFRPAQVDIPDVENDAPEAAPALVESLLAKVGPLEFTVVTSPHRKHSKAIARFFDESDAKDAMATLQGTACDFLNGGELTLQLLTSHTLRVNKQVYDSVEDQLAHFVTECEDKKVAYRTFVDPQNRFVTLRLESANPSDVIEAAKTVRAITDGTLLVDDKGPIWASSLRQKSPTTAAIQRLADVYGVRVIFSQAKRQIRYYGPPELFKGIKRGVSDLLNAATGASKSLPLDDAQFNWVFQRGLAQIRTRLGSSHVSLDIVSRPKKLQITGSDANLRWVAAQLALHKGEGEFPDCTICFTPADDPLTLSCNHVYCRECFEGLCTSTNSTTTDFEITCTGQDGQCESVIPIKEIKSHLPTGVFEDLLQTSFASHIR